MAGKSRRRARGRDLARPHGFDARHDHGPHQHHRHGASRRFEVADVPLVASEQIVHRGGGHGVHGKQIPGHVNAGLQLTVQRHVHAMVVPWREVHGDETAVAKRLHAALIAGQQRRQRVMAALGLQQTIPVESAALADYPVRGTGDPRGTQRPGARFQRARKKGIEALIGLGARGLRLG